MDHYMLNDRIRRHVLSLQTPTELGDNIDKSRLLIRHNESAVACARVSPERCVGHVLLKF